MLDQILISVIASLAASAFTGVVKFLIDKFLGSRIPKEILPKRQFKKNPETVPIESQANRNDPKNDGLDTKENLETKAHQGDMKAQFNLGVLYYRGRGNGIPTNYVLAYMWWNIARANGHEEAEIELAIISGEMTRGGVEKAQEKSTKLVEANPNLIKSSKD